MAPQRFYHCAVASARLSPVWRKSGPRKFQLCVCSKTCDHYARNPGWRRLSLSCENSELTPSLVFGCVQAVGCRSWRGPGHDEQPVVGRRLGPGRLRDPGRRGHQGADDRPVVPSPGSDQRRLLLAFHRHRGVPRRARAGVGRAARAHARRIGRRIDHQPGVRGPTGRPRSGRRATAPASARHDRRPHRVGGSPNCSCPFATATYRPTFRPSSIPSAGWRMDARPARGRSASTRRTTGYCGPDDGIYPALALLPAGGDARARQR